MRCYHGEVAIPLMMYISETSIVFESIQRQISNIIFIVKTCQKMSWSFMDKPPLGLRPRWLADIFRATEILDCFKRYIELAKPIPDEWIDEFVEINNRMKGGD